MPGVTLTRMDVINCGQIRMMHLPSGASGRRHAVAQRSQMALTIDRPAWMAMEMQAVARREPNMILGPAARSATARAKMF